MILSLTDFILLPFVLFIILYLSYIYKNKHIKNNPSFEYFMPGLLIKLFGGISVCLIYSLYYNGGDTTEFFSDGVKMINLLFKHPPSFFEIFFNGMGPYRQNYFLFDNQTGYPTYGGDNATFFVIRLITPFVLISFKNFIVATVLLAWVSYFGVWRLYQVFYSEFPELKKEMAIAVFFIPSVFFWGSGLLKDTVTFSAIGFFIFSFYKAFIKNDNLMSNAIAMLISSFLILTIRPYIFFAILPGSLLWIGSFIIGKYKSSFVKFFLTPILFGACFGAGYIVLESLRDKLGYYNLENVLERAVAVHRDLKQDHYFGSSFDIGDFEANITSILGKAPLAINAALFRPYLWEVNNPVMLLSGLENMFMLLLTIYLVFKVRIIKFIRLMFTHNLLVFSIIFSLFFAFSVGLTTSNFGSLVRYKIPLMPFYVASLFIIRYFDIQLSKKNEPEKDVIYGDKITSLRD